MLGWRAGTGKGQIMEKVLTQLEDSEIMVSDEQVWESVPGLRMQLSPLAIQSMRALSLISVLS